MIKAVIFDCDGTLFDTSFGIFAGYKYLFDKYRPDYKPTAEEYYSFLGPSLKEMFPKYFKEDINVLIEEYRQAGYAFTDKEHIEAYPHLIETLHLLKEQGIKLAVVSSRVHFSLLNILNIYDIADMFDVIVGFDDVKKGKPDPEGFIKVMNELNVLKDEIIMIGDHSGDILGAKNANIRSIAVGWTTYGVDKLVALGADKVMNDYNELPSIIKEM